MGARAGRGRGAGASAGREAPPRVNILREAALAFAARGWPVFPCSMANKQPLLAAAKDPATGRKIPGTGGLSRASVHPEEIKLWWKRWPLAMVGLATGHGRLFVVDFDPRVDADTGEEWTLERLKADLEAQIGCTLPPTLAARTPSGGVHLYFLWPPEPDGSDGAPIRNRGNLPTHVDVRGLGGYVIAPPSVMEDGRRYRWLHALDPDEVEIVEAPAALVGVLRAQKARPQSPKTNPQNPNAAAADAARRAARRPVRDGDAGSEAVRRYALAALDEELRLLAAAPMGDRNNQINARAFSLGQLVGAGALGEAMVRSALQAAVAGFGRDYEKCCQSIENGLAAGMGEPRDLGEIAAKARERASRAPHRRPAASGAGAASFRDGRVGEPFTGDRADPDELSAEEQARFAKISAAWLARRLAHVAPTPKALAALAFSAGRRVAAGLLDAGAVKEAIWPACERVADLQHADIDKSLEDGIARGFDPGRLRLTVACAAYPMTDFGLAERFRDRFGAEFRFTTAKGWLGWDGRRWKMLDQDKETPPAELVAAMFETVRAIQREANAIADTGIRWGLVNRKDGRKTIEQVDEEDEGNPHGLDRWVRKGRGFVRLSELLHGFGRQSELAGKPVAIANLARRWLTVPIEEFDCEQLAVNVMNGTLRFAVEADGEGRRAAAVRLDPHRREDLITRLAPVEWKPAAEAPLYDAMLEWAQPEPEMRRYLHQIAGYAITGHTGEHKLWYHYGRGRNGKSTTIDSWCSTLGDYSGTIAIESFLDQGIKKRGDQATPDLAKLGGVRMLRASEAERDSRLNSALIKAATGGEPMSVRALHRGFFDLLPRFKLMMSGNFKPSIPDTDDGIWGRLKLVLWGRHIDKPDEDPFRALFPDNHARWPRKDTDLLDKIKGAIGPGELDGVFRRLVEGLCDWLEHGLVEPQSVTEATQAYRDSSDPLARFLRLCTRPDPDSRIQSSRLHEVFVAWAKAAGEVGHKEWSNKGLSRAMEDKGYTRKQSNGMQWLGLKLVRQVSDFVDENGRVKALPDDMAAEPPNEGETDDDFLPSRARPPPPPGAAIVAPGDEEDVPF